MAILILEEVSKQHLASDSRVAPRSGIRANFITLRCITDLFKMLTYSNVCCAFSSVCALLSNAICHFETTSGRPDQIALKMVRSLLAAGPYVHSIIFELS